MVHERTTSQGRRHWRAQLLRVGGGEAKSVGKSTTVEHERPLDEGTHGNLVRGTKIPGKSVPPDQNTLKKLVRIRKKGSGLDFARGRPISQCDSVEFHVEVCGEYEKTRKTMPVT